MPSELDFSIVAVMGGSGSTYLIGRLEQIGYEVGNKPDTVFRPRFQETRIPGGYERSEGSFGERSKTDKFDGILELDRLLPQYLQYAQRRDDYVAVLNTSAELGLLSRFNVSNVLFLVRHPMHAYVSWASPTRHRDQVDHLGGLESERTLEFAARRWVRHTNEYFRLQHSGLSPMLVRYEFAQEDSKRQQIDSTVFGDLLSDRRHNDVLSPAAEDQLKRSTSTNFEAIYDDWCI